MSSESLKLLSNTVKPAVESVLDLRLVLVSRCLAWGHSASVCSSGATHSLPCFFWRDPSASCCVVFRWRLRGWFQAHAPLAPAGPCLAFCAPLPLASLCLFNLFVSRWSKMLWYGLILCSCYCNPRLLSTNYYSCPGRVFTSHLLLHKFHCHHRPTLP